MSTVSAAMRKRINIDMPDDKESGEGRIHSLSVSLLQILIFRRSRFSRCEGASSPILPYTASHTVASDLQVVISSFLLLISR